MKAVARDRYGERGESLGREGGGGARRARSGSGAASRVAVVCLASYSSRDNATIRMMASAGGRVFRESVGTFVTEIPATFVDSARLARAIRRDIFARPLSLRATNYCVALTAPALPALVGARARRGRGDSRARRRRCRSSRIAGGRASGSRSWTRATTSRRTSSRPSPRTCRPRRRRRSSCTWTVCAWARARPGTRGGRRGERCVAPQRMLQSAARARGRAPPEPELRRGEQRTLPRIRSAR